MVKKHGKIIIEYGANPKPHEIRTAQSLAAAGYIVTLVAKSEIDGVKTADARMNGEMWEMKAPEGNLKSVERNMHKALRQASCIILDSRRMSDIPGKAIEREVRVRAAKLKSLKRMLFVNKLGEVVEIK